MHFTHIPIDFQSTTHKNNGLQDLNLNPLLHSSHTKKCPLFTLLTFEFSKISTVDFYGFIYVCACIKYIIAK